MGIDRREFCLSIAASLAVGQACSKEPEEPARDTLDRMLGLTRDQTRWVDSLSPAQQVELRDRLVDPVARAERHTIQLLMKIFSPRERLYAYVGYPQIEQLGACDGLIRE